MRINQYKTSCSWLITGSLLLLFFSALYASDKVKIDKNYWVGQWKLYHYDGKDFVKSKMAWNLTADGSVFTCNTCVKSFVRKQSEYNYNKYKYSVKKINSNYHLTFILDNVNVVYIAKIVNNKLVKLEYHSSLRRGSQSSFVDKSKSDKRTILKRITAYKPGIAVSGSAAQSSYTAIKTKKIDNNRAGGWLFSTDDSDTAQKNRDGYQYDLGGFKLYMTCHEIADNAKKQNWRIDAIADVQDKWRNLRSRCPASAKTQKGERFSFTSIAIKKGIVIRGISYSKKDIPLSVFKKSIVNKFGKPHKRGASKEGVDYEYTFRTQKTVGQFAGERIVKIEVKHKNNEGKIILFDTNLYKLSETQFKKSVADAKKQEIDRKIKSGYYNPSF